MFNAPLTMSHHDINIFVPVGAGKGVGKGMGPWAPTAAGFEVRVTSDLDVVNPAAAGVLAPTGSEVRLSQNHFQILFN